MGTGQTVAKDFHHSLSPPQLKSRLTELLHRLEQIEAVVSVASAALRHQNCERDVDVARVLQREVGDRLSVEADNVRALLRTVTAGPPPARTNKNQRRRG